MVQPGAGSRVFGRMKRFSLAILVLSTLAVPALAQPGKARKEAPPPAAAAGKKVKRLDIEAIDVKGDRVVGQLGPISVAQAATHTSLIRIRRDYIDLILKSADEI